jgi:hypothetical protein
VAAEGGVIASTTAGVRGPRTASRFGRRSDAGTCTLAAWTPSQRHADRRRDLDAEGERPGSDDGEPAQAAFGDDCGVHQWTVNTISADSTRGPKGVVGSHNSARSTGCPA